MIHLRTFTGDGGFAQNGWLAVCDGSRKALVIDPGAAAPEMCRIIDEEDLDVEAIVLTHAHLDHVEGVPDVRALTDAPIYLHPKDQPLYSAAPMQAAAFGVSLRELPPPRQGPRTRGRARFRCLFLPSAACARPFPWARDSRE